MAKRKKPKIKKHIFNIEDEPVINDFDLIGIQTSQPLYKVVFDFNKQFNLGFKLDKDIVVERKKRSLKFENYSTPENPIGQKIRLLNNEILIPIEHPNTLFDTHEAFYLFPELPSINYLLMTPIDEMINYQYLNQNFLVSYPLRFVEIDIKKCATAFPVFPI
jgi:hypothetical protein